MFMASFKKRKLVISVDIILLFAILLLLSPRLTGLPLHEILGLVVFMPVMVHILNSWQWVRRTSKKIFITATTRTRVNYLINTILFALMVVVIVSGFFISEVTVPALAINLTKDTLWRSVHVQTTTFLMLFSGLHIAINLDWIIALFKKRKQTPAKNVSARSNHIVRIIQRILIVLLAASIVSFILIFLVGMPTTERLYHHSYIKEYMPTLKNGIGQFLGESFFVIVIAFIAHKWLRIKL